MAVSLAWRQLRHDPWRLLVAVLGVAFAVLLMLMQLGFRRAMLESAVRYQERLDYDLVLLSRQSVFIGITHPFPRRRLYQAAGLAGVDWVAPLYAYQQHFENPWQHNTRNLLIVGTDPRRVVLRTPGAADHLAKLARPDAILFDRLSRLEFGPIAESFDRGERVTTEIAGKQVEVVGLFELGSSFGIDGNVLTSEEGFLRLFPHRSQGSIDLGLIKLLPGTDPEPLRATLEAQLERDVEVLTRQGFAKREIGYWEGTTPIGYVFGFGLAMGFVVGAIIVYQILFASVSDHLSEYATLKALGYSDGAVGGIVLRQAVLLAAMGFVPGVVLTQVAYEVTGRALRMPVELSAGRSAAVLVLTMVMCSLAATMALRKVRQADPAELF
jgi:putative ABC transport system permease protein